MTPVETAATANIRRVQRAKYAALSGLTGWLAAQFLCLPFNLITAVRDSEGQARLFVQTLGYGLLAWAGWTLAIATAAWVLVVLPLVMTLRPCLLVRLRRWILLFAIALVGVVTVMRLPLFRDAGGASVWQRFALVLPYDLFGITFALVTGATYIQLSKRHLAANTAPE